MNPISQTKTHFSKIDDARATLCNQKAWNLVLVNDFSELTCSKCRGLIMKIHLSPETSVKKIDDGDDYKEEYL